MTADVWQAPVLIASVQPNPPVGGASNGSNGLGPVALAGVSGDNMAMVYLEGGSSNFPDAIYATVELQLVDPLGHTTGPTISVATNAYSPDLVGGQVSDPGVTSLAGGNIAVSYADGEYSQSTLRNDVFVSLYSATGAALGSRIELDSGVGNETAASVTPVTGGGFFAAWQDAPSGMAGGDGSGSGILGQLFDASGAKVGGQIQVNTPTAGDQTAPSATTLANGNVLVSWISGANVEAQMYSSAGAAIGGETTLSTAPGAGGSVLYDKVVALSGGGYALVREYINDIIATQNPFLDVQVFTAGGAPVGGPVQIDGGGLGYFTNSIDAAATADGGLTVAYTTDDGFVGRTYDFRAHILSNGTIGDTSTIATTSASTSAIGQGAIGVYADGRESFVWEQQQPGFADTLQESIIDDRANTSVMYASAANPVVVGGAGGTSRADNIIYGYDGPDTLYGAGGDDIIYGGSGPNLIVLGATGSSYAYGGAASDTLYAGAGGADALHGGAGSDTLYGGGGTDWLYGDGGGTDYMFAGSGTNYLFGNATSPGDIEVMVGGAGVSTMTGGIGANYFYGGAGASTMFGGSGQNIFSLGSETVGDTVYGGSGPNYIYGGAGPDVLEGGAGNDVIAAGSSNQSLYGLGGSDSFFAGSGTDVIVAGGNAGDVEVMNGSTGAATMYGGAGTNYFYTGSGATGMVGGTGLNIYVLGADANAGDAIQGGSGANYVYASADTAGMTFKAGGSVDVFQGGSGADTVEGGGGTLYAWGGSGADLFTVNAGDGGTLVEDWSVDDTVDFGPSTGLNNFAQVTAAETYVPDTNTTIITGANTAIWLVGVAPAELAASNFRFG